MTVSAIQRRPDGSLQALDENGWFEISDGDAVDMGRGQVMQLMGGNEIAGGSIKAGAFALLAGFVMLGIAGMFGFGKGLGS